MTVKEKSEKAGLKFNILKTRIMASGPTTSWEIYGEKLQTVRACIWGGGGRAPKSLQLMTAGIKVNDVCSLEEKPWPT